jgi:hypothetical protein
MPKKPGSLPSGQLSGGITLMKNNAEMIVTRTDLRKKADLTVSDGAAKEMTCELSRKREKWFKAVEYFTCVDDINF